MLREHNRPTAAVLIVLHCFIAADARIVSPTELSEHDAPDDCWSAFYGKVYDVTDYAPSHPGANRGGGPQAIWDVCGEDGTAPFDRVHGNEKHYLEFSQVLLIGDLGPDETAEPTPSPTVEPTTQPPTPEPSPNPTEASTSGPNNGSNEPVPPDPATVAPTPADTPLSSTLAPTISPTTAVPTTVTPTTATPTTAVPTTAAPTTATPTPTPTPTTLTTITLEELQEHSTPDDCWVLFHDFVYSMTEYAPTHPGPGPIVIYPYCGGNGTDSFALVHPESYLDLVQDEVVGVMDTTDEPAAPPVERVVSRDELAMHTTPGDCWLGLHAKVYDMTAYAYIHPGPAEAAIHPYCGMEATRAFSQFHSQDMLDDVESEVVGVLEEGSGAFTEVKLGFIMSVFCWIGTLWMSL